MASAAPSDNRDLVLVGPVKRAHGRPSLFTDELAAEICERLAAGETLTGICLDEHMPTVRTVSNWMMRRPEFFSEVARAREAAMHLEAEQVREIADNAYEDYYIDYKDGVPFVVVNNESVKRAALRIDARKWRAAALNRRFYGNSIRHEVETPPNPAADAEQLPAGLAWLQGILPEPEK